VITVETNEFGSYLQELLTSILLKTNRDSGSGRTN